MLIPRIMRGGSAYSRWQNARSLSTTPYTMKGSARLSPKGKLRRRKEMKPFEVV